MGEGAARGELGRALAGPPSPVVGFQLLLGRSRPDIAPDERGVGERDDVVEVRVRLHRLAEPGVHRVEAAGILMVAPAQPASSATSGLCARAGDAARRDRPATARNEGRPRQEPGDHVAHATILRES